MGLGADYREYVARAAKPLERERGNYGGMAKGIPYQIIKTV
jgi:hypothetical protein